MGRLAGKLARLGHAGPGSRATPAAAEGDRRRDRIAALRRTLDAMEASERSALRDEAEAEPAAEPGLLARVLRDAPALAQQGPAKALPGRRADTPHGPVHTVATWLEPHHHHGCVPIRSALAAKSPRVAELALDPALEGVDLSRMLLVDTETTGLGTSAGTVPFLVGVAFFEDESLLVEQLLLTRLGEEGPLLRHLAERIEAASCVVSYNGKSFDWPLLRARFVLNRIPAPTLPPHLDLLHCARRLYKRRLDRVRLVDMEREVLGFVREHDVDGAEIPGIYLQFLRSGCPGRLDAVVEHNGHDLVALAALLGELASRYGALRRELEPDEQLGFATVAERAGNARLARAFAEAAAAGGGDARCTVDALLLAARLARRERRLADEGLALTRAFAARPDDARVRLALAKFHEHRSKDLGQALEHARHTCPLETEGERDHRVARLEARLARRGEAPALPGLRA
ncbi:MAG: ribonuclease H-like domain-containing protein [Myxococcota bacterium]